MTACTGVVVVSFLWLHAVAIRIGEDSGVHESTSLEETCGTLTCNTGYCGAGDQFVQRAADPPRDTVGVAGPADPTGCTERYHAMGAGQAMTCRRNARTKFQTFTLQSTVICNSCQCHPDAGNVAAPAVQQVAPAVQQPRGFSVEARDMKTGNVQELRVSSESRNVFDTIANQHAEADEVHIGGEPIHREDTFADVGIEDGARIFFVPKTQPITIMLRGHWGRSQDGIPEPALRFGLYPQQFELPGECSLAELRSIIQQELQMRVETVALQSDYDRSPLENGGPGITSDEEFLAALEEHHDANLILCESTMLGMHQGDPCINFVFDDE